MHGHRCRRTSLDRATCLQNAGTRMLFLPTVGCESESEVAFVAADGDGEGDGRLNRAAMQAAVAVMLPNKLWDDRLWPAMCVQWRRALCSAGVGQAS